MPHRASFLTLALGFLVAPMLSAAPLQLHPDNPRYFLFHRRPTILLTSGEHYGAVLNLDFNYTTYLDTLAADGLNLTRTFSGAYVEPAGAFNIARNTLAPGPGRFIAPWARGDVPGYPLGGNKFDLQRWDEAYFARLQDFVRQADRRRIVVEMNLFCPFYGEEQWRLSPQNAANNIHQVGAVPRTNVYTLDRHGGLLPIHEALTRKIVTELNRFDNVYYEICNEPYFGGVTLDWQHRIADVIAETERALPKRHLISRNVANGAARVDVPHPAISIYNFHYASPPDAVALNAHLPAVIGDNETGFRGTNDLPYRVEAWNFLLAGGALFNHLDYSFVAGHEDGSFVYPTTQPGGGNPAFRRQLRNLGVFLRAFDLLKCQPLPGGVRVKPSGWTIRAFGQPGRDLAVYLAPELDGSGKPKIPLPSSSTASAARLELELDFPAGRYRVDWLDPLSGSSLGRARVPHPGGVLSLQAPAFSEDLAARIRRTGGS